MLLVLPFSVEDCQEFCWDTLLASSSSGVIPDDGVGSRSFELISPGSGQGPDGIFWRSEGASCKSVVPYL